MGVGSQFAHCCNAANFCGRGQLVRLLLSLVGPRVGHDRVVLFFECVSAGACLCVCVLMALQVMRLSCFGLSVCGRSCNERNVEGLLRSCYRRRDSGVAGPVGGGRVRVLMGRWPAPGGSDGRGQGCCSSRIQGTLGRTSFRALLFPSCRWCDRSGVDIHFLGVGVDPLQSALF